jgi:hypothetical protein
MTNNPRSPTGTSDSPEPTDAASPDNTDAGRDLESQASAEPPSDESMATNPWIRNKPS